MLALEHALRGAPGIASLILASTTASVPDWQREVGALIGLLPEPHRSTLQAARASGNWQDAALAAALQTFAARHLYRGGFPATLPEPPPSHAYHALFGSSELDVSGRLKEWDVSARLGEIGVPALIIGGGHDEMTPLVTGALHRGIPYSEYALF
jgi:proline-specific peptidase